MSRVDDLQGDYYKAEDWYDRHPEYDDDREEEDEPDDDPFMERATCYVACAAGVAYLVALVVFS